MYVGETSCTLRVRMTQHRSDITHNEDTPVAAHLSQPGHQPRVMVLESALRDVIQRKILESQWIARLRSAATVLSRDDGIEITEVERSTPFNA